MNSKIVIDINNNNIIYGLGGYNKPSGQFYLDNIDIDDIIDIVLDKLNISKNYSLYISHSHNNILNSKKYNLKYYNRHILALYSICKDTGLVLDFNKNHTKIVPIYEGILLDTYIKYSNISLDKFDNNIPDVITNPHKYSLDCDPLHDSIILCIKSLPIDIRKNILQNILIISDGKMTGFKIADMIVKNIRDSYNPKYMMNINSPKTKIIQSWLGGSIVSCIKSIKISK